MPEIPNEDTLELWLLGDAVRMLKRGRCRLPPGSLAHVVLDPATGQPANPSDLLPDSFALRGPHLVFQWVILPRVWATSHMGLTGTKEPEWSPEALHAVDLTEARIRRVIRRMSQKGYLDPHPDLGLGELGVCTVESGGNGRALGLVHELDGAISDHGDPAFCQACRFTAEGLRYAEKRVEGTALDAGPFSVVHDLPPERRLQLPAHIEAEWRREARA